MTLKDLQNKAQQFHQKTQRELYINLAAAFVLALCAAGLLKTQNPVARLGFATALV